MVSVALLVGGSVNDTSRGTKLLLLPCLSTHPISSSAGLSAWFELALGHGSW